jgi:hypothetical protein
MHPACSQEEGSASGTAQEQQDACLALSVLRSACKLKDLAASQPLLDRVPTLVKVSRQTGRRGYFSNSLSSAREHHNHHNQPQPTSPPQVVKTGIKDGAAATSASAVTDALESLLGIAGSGAQDAPRRLLDAGGLEAATKVLTRAADTGAGGLGLLNASKAESALGAVQTVAEGQDLGQVGGGRVCPT